MNQQPFVLIVILNWNDPDETISAVESVFQMDYTNFRVVVIDNGSTDDSVERLRPLANERVELIEVPVNTGYTGGSNLGMKRALEMGADYAWLLNNDTTADPHTLSSLVALAESDERIGLVSPMISTLGDTQKIVFAGGWWDKKTRSYVDTHDIDLAKRWMQEHPDAGVVFGTALLVPARVIRKIGFLDDKFFAYYEDFDYSIRSLDAGFRNVVDWSSSVYHLNKSMEKRPHEIRPHYWYYVARNERRLWRKHLGPINSLRISWWGTNKFLRYRNHCKGDPIACEAILAGIWDGWTNKTGAYSPTFRAPRLFASLVDIYSKRSSLQVSKPAD
jgi:GT2 family glycosyltransferase